MSGAVVGSTRLMSGAGAVLSHHTAFHASDTLTFLELPRGHTMSNCHYLVIRERSSGQLEQCDEHRNPFDSILLGVNPMISSRNCTRALQHSSVNCHKLPFESIADFH